MRIYTDIEVATMIAIYKTHKRFLDFDRKYDELSLSKDIHQKLFKNEDEDDVLAAIYMVATRRDYQLPLLRPRIIKYMTDEAADLLIFAIETKQTIPPAGARSIKNWNKEKFKPY